LLQRVLDHKARIARYMKRNACQMVKYSSGEGKIKEEWLLNNKNDRWFDEIKLDYSRIADKPLKEHN